MSQFDVEERRTPVEGVPVYARVAVDGDREKPVIVLLHGLGLSSRYMLPLVRELRRSFQVYAPELPGFGHSGKGRVASTVAQQTEELRKWLDAVGIGRVSLFGNSLGAQVAVDFAQRFPERTDRVVLAGPTPDPRSRSFLRLYTWQLRNMPLEPLGMQLIYLMDYAQTGLFRMLKTMYRTCDDPIDTKLPAIQAPTLVLRGEHDQVAPQVWAEQVAATLPNGELAVIEGAAHCAHFSRAVEVARIITQFFRRTASDSTLGQQSLFGTA